MEIRDPIHGPIEISAAEARVLSHPLVQRLRRIRQLGFSEETFPGATHTRFLHSVGAMHLAGLAFDAVGRDLEPPPPDRDRWRAVLRMAALLHDVGHPPFSHSGERILPRAEDLGLAGPERIASHEEMTRHLILHSDIADRIREAFGELGVEPEHVATVLVGDASEDDPAFRCDGRTVLPVLRRLISGDLDVDRMDYLLRDSYFTGVTYGRFDRDWLLSHLGCLPLETRWCLALDSRALFAFEDFLLSRFHMFLMVYFHRRTVAYDRMFQRFLEGGGHDLRVPPDPAAFARCDDEWLWAAIRDADDPWAARIREHRPIRLAVEAWGDEVDALQRARQALEGKLPDSCEWVDSGLGVSKHLPPGQRADPDALRVRISHPASGRRVVPMNEYSDLLSRGGGRKRVLRLYCDEEDLQTVSRALSFVVNPDGRVQ